jgi:hypothetical protein
LRKKFLERVNSGIKYHTIHDITIDLFWPQIYAQFSMLTKMEVKHLVMFGFRRMHSAMKSGCAISIQVKRYYNCIAHIGAVWADIPKQFQQYSVRRDNKLRRISSWKRPPFDGYYYIGLNETAFLKWVDANKTSKSLFKFTHVRPRKLVEELYYKDKHMYIFKFTVKKYRGWHYLAEELVIRKVEFLGEAIDRCFYPSSKPVKELIKEYAKRKY